MERSEFHWPARACDSTQLHSNFCVKLAHSDMVFCRLGTNTDVSLWSLETKCIFFIVKTSYSFFIMHCQFDNRVWLAGCPDTSSHFVLACTIKVKNKASVTWIDVNDYMLTTPYVNNALVKAAGLRFVSVWKRRAPRCIFLFCCSVEKRTVFQRSALPSHTAL